MGYGEEEVERGEGKEKGKEAMNYRRYMSEVIAKVSERGCSLKSAELLAGAVVREATRGS